MVISLSVTTATKYTNSNDGHSTFDYDAACEHQREHGGVLRLDSVQTTEYTVGDRSTLDSDEADRWSRP